MMFSGLKTKQRGVAAIEFVLVLPLLLLLLGAMIELGFGFYDAMLVDNSAEAGAIYAAANGYDAAGITAAVVKATGSSGITASPAPTQYCGCSAASGITTIACSATCTGGVTPGQYVQINAKMTYTPIMSVSGLIVPATLTGQSIVRIQ